jgi:hypothetical protein
MPRQIPGPVPGSTVEFVPTALGNLSLPDGERLRVFIRAPTERDRREYYSDSLGLFEVVVDAKNEPVLDGDGNRMMRFDHKSADRQREMAIARFVERVENYVDQEGKPVVDGKRLSEVAEMPFFKEVADRIRDMLGLQEEQKASH